MTIAKITDAIRNWLNDEVCPSIQLKQSYDYNQFEFVLVNPVAYSGYAPAITEDAKRIPHIVVMPASGEDMEDSGVIHYFLDIVLWNPGLHVNSDVKSEPQEGWRDLTNIVDRLRRALGNARILKNRVKVGHPIKYMVYTSQDLLPDSDYYRGNIEFDVTFFIERNTIYSDLI